MAAHLEGMGVLGSALAWVLHRAGADFTWSDNLQPSSWQASAGLIKPGVTDAECRAHARWLADDAAARAAPTVTLLHNFLGVYPLWYNRWPGAPGRLLLARQKCGDLSLCPEPALVLNVPGYVYFTRSFFAERRRDVVPSAAVLVAAHGYTPPAGDDVAARLGKPGRRTYNWGWLASVRVRVSPEVAAAGPRPALRLHYGKLRHCYLAAVPMRDHYVLGSAWVPQQTPHELPIEDRLAEACRHVEDTTGGLVSVAAVNEVGCGWRPQGDESNGLHTEPWWQDGRLILPPLGRRGVTFAPLVADAAAAMILGHAARPGPISASAGP